MKTTNQILTDIWAVVTASSINALNGGVYKKTRPTASVLEDCVISLIPGSGKKFLQDGAIYIKIFYADIFLNNSWLEDATNGAAKETLLITLSETLLKNTTYSFDIASREIYTEAVEEIHQHYAILKMNFELTYN
jgi:hypothetical protein